jgi:nucleotide-binding universal stress UspA family protein
MLKGADFKPAPFVTGYSLPVEDDYVVQLQERAAILVPLDGSELSEQALPIARDLALQLGSTIHLIHAVSIEHELSAGRNVQPIQVVEIEVEQAHRLTEAQIRQPATRSAKGVRRQGG